LLLAGAGAVEASLASWRASLDLRRAALLGCRMRLEAARSSPRMASTVDSIRSEESAWASFSERRDLTMRVFTSERTARFRAERRTPARACFFAEAVRLATRHYQGRALTNLGL